MSAEEEEEKNNMRQVDLAKHLRGDEFELRRE